MALAESARIFVAFALLERLHRNGLATAKDDLSTTKHFFAEEFDSFKIVGS